MQVKYTSVRRYTKEEVLNRAPLWTADRILSIMRNLPRLGGYSHFMQGILEVQSRITTDGL